MKIKILIVFSLFLAIGVAYFVYRIQTQPINSEKILNEFISHATRIKATQRFQFAELSQVEVIKKTSKKKILWEKLNLPDVIVQAEMPVAYIYFIDLKKEWSIEKNDGIFYVTTSPIEFNRPSIDVANLKFEIKKSSLLRNEVKVAQKLQNELMEHLEIRAKENIHLIREIGRKEIQMLFQKWLDESGYKGQVKIRFPDELDSNLTPINWHQNYQFFYQIAETDRSIECFSPPL